MKDKMIQIKKPNRIDSSKISQGFKLTINDPTLKKYLEMTLSRFTTKCSLLVNQIDDMKREFITQIEGLNEFFPNTQSKIPLPIVSPVRKNRDKKTEHIQLLQEINNANIIFTDGISHNNKFYLNTNSNQYQYQNQSQNKPLVINKQQLRNEHKDLNDVPYSKTTKINPESFFEKKLSILIKDTNDEDMRLKINLSKDNNNNTINNRYRKNIPPKTRALMSLRNSELLCFEEKIKLSSLNRQMHKETQTSEIIASSRKFLEEKMKGLEDKKKDNLPSQTSQSSLNFIKKENENDLKDMSNKFNRAFYELVYILSGETVPINISYEHLYESILRKNQMQSIKHLFLSVYMKKLVEAPLKYSNEIIEKFNSVIKQNPELISQNELFNENKSLSLFAFCLKEFYQFFQYEMERRDEINRLKLLLSQVNDWAQTHHFV